MHKEVNVIVGGNGSGKSTFYYRYLAKFGLPFLNADELAKQQWPGESEKHSYEAARLIADKRNLFISTGQSFCFETVFSHPSKVDFLAQAKTKGFTVNLFVIHINDTNDGTSNIARVANRVSHGGHHVPDEKILSRIPRMLALVSQAIPLCETVSFFDNTLCEHPYQRIAILNTQRTLFTNKELPIWVEQCIKDQFLRKEAFRAC